METIAIIAGGILVLCAFTVFTGFFIAVGARDAELEEMDTERL